MSGLGLSSADSMGQAMPRFDAVDRLFASDEAPELLEVADFTSVEQAVPVSKSTPELAALAAVRLRQQFGLPQAQTVAIALLIARIFGGRNGVPHSQSWN